MANQPHVVILGAGFAGLGALKKLEKAPVTASLIDRNDYHSFLPLLYQVATAELATSEVAFPARELLHGREGFQFHQAEISNIDLDEHTVTAESTDPIHYDYLLVGLGAVVNFFGTPGAQENAFPLYTVSDAMKLKSHIFACFEAADRDATLVDDGALRFCVVGGGATGVEISGAIAEMLTGELRKDYPKLPVEKAEVHLYELAPNLLTPFQPKLQAYTKNALEKRGVQVHLGDGVTAVEPTRVQLKSGAEIKAHTLVWAAGLKASPITAAVTDELDRGRAAVGPDLSLSDHPEVFVVGDMAMITDAKTGDKLPQLGSVALQAGTHAGENIALLASGKGTKPFEYEDKGTMATIGRGAAIVQMHNGKTMTGEAAWLAWLGVHLMLLSGGQQKGDALVDWGWNVVTKGRSKHVDPA